MTTDLLAAKNSTNNSTSLASDLEDVIASLAQAQLENKLCGEEGTGTER